MDVLPEASMELRWSFHKVEDALPKIIPSLCRNTILLTMQPRSHMANFDDEFWHKCRTSIKAPAKYRATAGGRNILRTRKLRAVRYRFSRFSRQQLCEPKEWQSHESRAKRKDNWKRGGSARPENPKKSHKENLCKRQQKSPKLRRR